MPLITVENHVNLSLISLNIAPGTFLAFAAGDLARGDGAPLGSRFALRADRVSTIVAVTAATAARLALL